MTWTIVSGADRRLTRMPALFFMDAASSNASVLSDVTPPGSSTWTVALEPLGIGHCALPQLPAAQTSGKRFVFHPCARMRSLPLNALYGWGLKTPALKLFFGNGGTAE